MTQAIDFQHLTQIQNHQQSLPEEVEKEDMRRLLNTLTEGFRSHPNFFQDDNDAQKRQKRNIATRK